MNRLRYEGYELPVMSLLEAKQFATELSEGLPRIAAREINRWYAERVVMLLDLAHFTPQSALRPTLSRILGAQASEADETAPAPALVHRAFERARRLQDRTLDMSAYLDLLPLEKCTLALIEARCERLRGQILGDERFNNDCLYYTNDTPPEGVSDAEWIRREALWRAALLSSGDERRERIRLVLHTNEESDVPEHEAALPGRQTLHSRVHEHARRLVVAERVRLLERDQDPHVDPWQVYGQATRGISRDTDPTFLQIVGILSDHLPESYAPDGREAGAGLHELYDRWLRKRLDAALRDVRVPEPQPQPKSNPENLTRYIGKLERWR